MYTAGHSTEMVQWRFEGGEDACSWRWSCAESATGRVLRTSARAFETLKACVSDAQKHGYRAARLPWEDRSPIRASDIAAHLSGKSTSR